MTPSLLNEYVSLYLQESDMQLSGSVLLDEGPNDSQLHCSKCEVISNVMPT